MLAYEKKMLDPQTSWATVAKPLRSENEKSLFPARERLRRQVKDLKEMMERLGV